MAYIGNNLEVAFQSYLIIDDISSGFDGSETSFTLNVNGSVPVPFPINPQQCLISVAGVIQEPDPTGSSGFNLSGNNIVFSSAPAGSSSFFGVVLAGADYVNVGVDFPAGSESAPSITFVDDKDSGFFSKGANEIGITCAGSEVGVFSATGLNCGFANGSAASPGIFFTSDTNTGIARAAADELIISAGGVERASFGSSEVAFNDPSNDVDFRVESNGNTHMLYVDAGNDRVGIGTSSPGANLDIFASANPTIRLTDSAGSRGEFIYNESGSVSALTIAADPDDASTPATDMRFTIDGSTVMYIDDSGDVGLGTASPSFGHGGGLEIHRSGAATLRVERTGATVSALEITAENGITRLDTRTNTPMAFHTNTNEQMRIDSSGNVGIGVTNPGDFNANAEKLVLANGGDDVGITLDCDTNKVGSIYFADGSTGDNLLRGQIVYDHSTDSLRLATNASERTRIDSSGRMLLGTSSSRGVGSSTQARLQVELAAGQTAVSIVNNYAAATGAILALGHSRTTSIGSNTVLQSGDQLGQIRFAGADGTDLQSYGATITAVVDGTPGSNDMPGRIVISTTASGDASPTERMRITSEGRVGIGTASPSNKLVVSTSDKNFEFNPGTTNTILSYDRGASAYLDMKTRALSHTWSSGSAEWLQINSSGVLVKYGNSTTARIIPQTDNAGYIGQSDKRWQAIYAVNGTIQTSDEREKTEIVDSPLGTDFIKSLRPVAYKWKVGGYDHSYDEEGEEVFTPVPGARTHYGFIAQEVRQATGDTDFGGWLIEDLDDPESKQSLRLHEFISPIVKALQESIAKIETLEAKIETLENKVAALEAG